jgi:flagellar biosynthesis/type III secretory pathway protein FliH
LPDILKQVKQTAVGQAAVRIPDVDFNPPAPLPPPEPEKETEELPGEPPVEEEQEPAAPPEPEKPPLTREELLALYEPELNALREEEGMRAYSDARARKAGELKQCILEVEQRMGELENQQQSYMASYAKDLKYLAVEIAEKFVNEKIDKNDLSLQRLVLNTVAKVKNANWLTVELSDRMVELISYMKTELQKPEYRGTAEVSPVSAPKDTVRVTTDMGTTDATISVQANNLRDLFDSMDSQN